MLQLDELRRETDTSALIAGMYRAAGADKVEFPDWVKVRGDFDEWLVGVPAVVAGDRKSVMLRALGLR